MRTGRQLVVNWTFDGVARRRRRALALIDADRETWDVSPARHCVAEGDIRHMPTGRSLRYGEIVAKVLRSRRRSRGRAEGRSRSQETRD